MRFQAVSVHQGSIPSRLLKLLHLDEVANVPSDDAQLVGFVELFQLVAQVLAIDHLSIDFKPFKAI